jgi:hypothetical protein
VLTPIAPSINSRDVGDSRLLDELQLQLLKVSSCHAMFGRILSKEEFKNATNGDETHSNMLQMSSVLGRCNVNMNDNYFSNVIDISELKAKVKQITSKFDDEDFKTSAIDKNK